MSQYENNNFLHNIRVGAKMVKKGMDPDVASLALAKQGINAPAPMLQAAAQPGVMESMGAKPYTHKRAEQQIAAHESMRASLAEARMRIQEQPMMDDDDDDDKLVVNFIEDDEEDCQG